MAKIRTSLGIYNINEEKLLKKEKTALLALLNQLKIDSLKCSFEIDLLEKNSKNLFAIIEWSANTDREKLQLKRRIENILSQVGKR